ncbi:hypothetical protein ABEY13_01255 [Bacillus velezensis]|uniref:hypothetical protein n=1 Tax=Bacillus velezensis TaxID=492670 RepID=UPI002DB912D1|nr:hypothetical protein [Bacillus velezensis]MEC3659208.1 hypothetical protein [Bacillus velezensis]MEC3685446.1 hypothetical protein [Bacillus velezensis]MEC3788396.1 hypothetical protein [Bacillus velezensis]MEC3849972.1 hypothetical protein [Bacillus velezensis]
MREESKTIRNYLEIIHNLQLKNSPETHEVYKQKLKEILPRMKEDVHPEVYTNLVKPSQKYLENKISFEEFDRITSDFLANI